MAKKIDRESLLDAFTVLYDECNEDPIKKCHELLRTFVEKYRSALAELRRARVCISNFEIIQLIGHGHYGEVHMVRVKQKADVYALKSVPKEEVRKRVVGAEDERNILATASSNWIPKLQYAFQDSNKLYLVMELCNGGDLAGLLSRQNHPLSERDAAFYIAEDAHALKALHGMGYIHRDIKPQNIFLDRGGHVKLVDFGSFAHLSEGGCVVGGTADYGAPELLSSDCTTAHTMCLCRRVNTAISACGYWSLGVVAFELSSKFRASFRAAASQPFIIMAVTSGGTITCIRDQAPPWVPHLRGAEDTTYLPAPGRVPSPPSTAPFRTRPPFAGQLPFVGYSYMAPEEEDIHSGGFSTSHYLTAIDLATYKSAEKLASLQNKLVTAEAAASEAAERARRLADEDHERLRAALQADITSLTLHNKRLERQIDIEMNK
ncbi:unnamed protein product [Danaus chrysippus]|uniref:(African queen) hypothetical protein n=1 Tax=Danaus chrysippus TaxID=151541 RepID=A0A8J2W5R2_9NEOP|nr:unnamed protein product [Danaus chrysippus]